MCSFECLANKVHSLNTCVTSEEIKHCTKGCGDGPVAEVLAVQARGAEFRSPAFACPASLDKTMNYLNQKRYRGIEEDT